MKFHYNISEQRRQAHWIATGETLPRDEILELDEKQFTPEQRAKLVALGNHNWGGNTFGGLSIGQYVTPEGKLPVFGGQQIALDEPLTEQTLWEHVDRMLAEKEQAKIIKAQEEAERAAAKLRQQAELDAHFERMAALKAQRKAEAAPQPIAWKDDDTAIVDLYDMVVAVAGDEQDSRFRDDNWVKQVDEVVDGFDNGYMFAGHFIKHGTIQIVKTPRVFIVSSTSGSRKNNVTVYRVVLMNADGQLERTDIHTDNTKAGWALRLRDQVKALLEPTPF